MASQPTASRGKRTKRGLGELSIEDQQNEILRALVCLFRFPNLARLGNTQCYTAGQLLVWQTKFRDPATKGAPKNVAVLFDKGVDLTESNLDRLIAMQKGDPRIGSAIVDGAKVYYAHQGLGDGVAYQMLRSVPLGILFIAHMTNWIAGQGIYGCVEVKVSAKKSRQLKDAPKVGWLCGVGRDLHGFVCGHNGKHVVASVMPVNVQQNESRYECAIGIDVEKLLAYYHDKQRDTIFMINEIGTILIFVPVPPECLVYGSNGPVDAETFWGKVSEPPKLSE